MRTSRSECGNLSGCSTRVSNAENSAVFAPMPSASVITATAVNPGDLRSWRKAKRMSFNMEVLQLSGSFGSQGNDRINTRGAPRRHPAGDQRDDYEREQG